jgi:hypothetical protein
MQKERGEYREKAKNRVGRREVKNKKVDKEGRSRGINKVM